MLPSFRAKAIRWRSYGIKFELLRMSLSTQRRTVLHEVMALLCDLSQVENRPDCSHILSINFFLNFSHYSAFPMGSRKACPNVLSSNVM